MKYLIVVLVIVVVGWLLLRSREKPEARARAAPARKTPQSMVQCRHCGVHLPRGDAIEGPNGVFCSEAHRLAGPR
jgi:uncharacterized protein